MKPPIVKKTYGSEKWNTTTDYSLIDNWLSLPETQNKNVDMIYLGCATERKQEQIIIVIKPNI